jgi:hypothetical protein
MPLVEFEPKTSLFELKTVHASDHAATVIGCSCTISQVYSMSF